MRCFGKFKIKGMLVNVVHGSSPKKPAKTYIYITKTVNGLHNHCTLLSNINLVPRSPTAMGKGDLTFQCKTE